MSSPDSGTSAHRLDKPDRHQIPRLNQLWAIVDEPMSGGTVTARLAHTARRLLGRVLSRQQEFNAAIVDHLNRNYPIFERTVVRMEDLADDLHRQREALAARERRHESAMTAVLASHAELRSAVNVLQQAAQQLKRELAARPSGAVATSSASTPAAAASTTTTHAAEPGTGRTQFESLDSHKYVGFENEFRGSPEDITARIASYLPIFEGASDVLDVGCGRGEFLERLASAGIRARGIDLNPSMVDVCVAKGLDVTAADALSYLRAQPDASLGGLFAAQVVEHLEPSYLIQFLDAAYDKLRPGAPIVLETINPACWLAFFESYIRDITHVRPIHPDTLRYLLVASGFQQAEVQYRSPYPETEKLQAVSTPQASEAALADLVETLNGNVAKLNGLLFTWMDYAAIARRA